MMGSAASHSKERHEVFFPLLFFFLFLLSRVSIVSTGRKIVAQTSASVTKQDPVDLFYLLANFSNCHCNKFF